MKWEILFYETSTGRVPVEDYLNRLPPGDRQRVGRWLTRLQEFGLEQPPGRIEHIVDKIWELKVTGTQGEHRVLYYVHQNCATLLSAFLKKTDKTPQREIELASRRCRDWMERYNEWRDRCPGSFATGSKSN